MDRSAVKAIVEREIERYAERLGIPHWYLKCSYDLKEDNQGRQANAQCTRHIDYNQAWIEFAPDEFEDEEHVLKVLRHELYHIVLSPFDLYSSCVRRLFKDGSPELEMLERIFDHAQEKAVINLGRMYVGLTKELPMKKSNPKTATPKATKKAAPKSKMPKATKKAGGKMTNGSTGYGMV